MRVGSVVSGDEMQPITQKFIAELIDAADGDMKVWTWSRIRTMGPAARR